MPIDKSATSTNQAPQVLAAFDVDGTLTWTDSFMLFCRFITGRWRFLAILISLIPTFLAYLLRLKSRDETKEQLLTRFLGGLSFEDYLSYCRSFGKTVYPQILREDAIVRLRSHQGVADHVALVSASLEDYLKPFAETVAVDAVIATRVEVMNGRLTGRLLGLNCRAEQKIARIKSQFGDIKIIAAYGDSRGDKEMLEAADYAGYRIFRESPRNARQLWLNMYFGTLLERWRQEET